jgi:thermitase
LIRAVESLGFTVLDSPDDMSMARLQVPRSMNILEALEKVRYTSLVEGADPITIMHVSATPNDQYYSNQWGLLKVSATSAWDITTGNSNIIIGILDTGIPLQNNSLSHPDLQNSSRIILGNDYTGDGDGVKDRHGHGTHVIGIASAETNNSIGVAGMSWNTKIFVVQVFDSLEW